MIGILVLGGLLVLAVLGLLALGIATNKTSPEADYTVREMAGELTPNELAAEEREERENYKRRFSMFQKGGD